MFDHRKYFDIFCKEEHADMKLSFDMPEGYETAYGTFDSVTKTVYINAFLLRDAQDPENAFYLYHELRHGMQYLYPERFSKEILKSLPYTIMYDGTCYKLKDGKYSVCKLEGGEEVFTDIYLGQPYEVDANVFAYEQVKRIWGDSEILRKLYETWMPRHPAPAKLYDNFYSMIDEKTQK